MKTLKLAAILTENRSLAPPPGERPYRVKLLSNIVLSPLGDVLELALRRRGVGAVATYGSYDNIVQESAAAESADAVVLFWEAVNMLPMAEARWSALEAEEVSVLEAQIQAGLGLAMRQLGAVPVVLVNRFSALCFAADEVRPGPFEQMLSRLNAWLEREAPPNVVVVDPERVLSKVGLGLAVDWRQFQMSRALYTLEFHKAYAVHVAPVFSAAAGRAKKVLVLDCDNTLWGGIQGEDGPDGIELGEDTRTGRVFREVQRLVKSLAREGVLLAICSKNNPDDVAQVLESHPDMELRAVNFSAIRVNWDSKAENLRAIARELNVGLDSLVFVDDSEFELGAVRLALPEVETLRVPAQLSEYPAALRAARPLFFSFARTGEDLARTDMVRTEAVRRDAMAAFASNEDFLRSLELRLSIRQGDAVGLPRAAQLILKTNQFNLNGRRHTEAELVQRLSDAQARPVSVAVADRFGDYGVTGIALLAVAERRMTIETLLLSCRVLGRQVERVFMDWLVATARAEGAESIVAEYRATPKNLQVAPFLIAAGFAPTDASDSGGSYQLQIADYRPSGIDYIGVGEE